VFTNLEVRSQLISNWPIDIRFEQQTVKSPCPIPWGDKRDGSLEEKRPGSAEELPPPRQFGPENFTSKWPSKEEKMTSNEMNSQMSTKQGFIAALDQSGGSTPGALRYYGIPDSAYSGETEMFKLMHEMRVRIMSSPAFRGDKVIGAILFEGTMDGQAKGKPVPAFLWEDRGVVPFLKVDKGLETEKDAVSLMKPIAGLDSLLERAAKLGVYGTKMRSTIHLPSKTGIAAIVAQQFAFAAQIAEHGLMPILEPEVLIKSPDKPGAEAILREELARGLDELPVGHRVMLKLTIPDVPDYYSPLIERSRVARVVALSGGYSRKDACHRLAANHGMIASFSRALVEDLRYSMSDTEFDASLSKSIDEIYQASVAKVSTDLPAGK
jgi:fructose-bisphosphate aldolase class I